MTTATPEKVLPKGDLFGEVEINGAVQRNKIGTWELTDEPSGYLEALRDSSGVPDALFRLEPKFKARWIADLLSRAYEQGQSQLCDLQNRRCCLGVAFNSLVSVRQDLRLQIHEGKHLKTLQLFQRQPSFGGKELWEPSEPADRVASTLLMELSGLEDSMGALNHIVRITYTSGVEHETSLEGSLAALNDDGLTFEDIAAIIEADL